MIPLEYLVIGVANHFQVFINKPFMNGSRDGNNINLCFQVCEDHVQPFQLFGVIGKQIDIVFFEFV